MPPNHQVPALNGSPGSDDDEDETVDELLYSAQMDFITHRPTSEAIAKLQKAVNLGSSSACATLGNLLSRGFRSVSSPQTPLYSPEGKGGYMAAGQRTSTSPRTPGSIGQNHDDVSAARLFVMGLEVETEKLLTKSRHGRLHGADGGDSDSDTEDDGAEGVFFSLSRTLDLVIGLTDAYRYGVLHPAIGAHDGEANALWVAGAQVAEKALRHPALVEPLDRNAVPSALESLNRNRTATSSPRTAPLRSYAHPSTALASTPSYHASFSPSSSPSTRSPSFHLTHDVQLRHTIQIHLYYLLALQHWPTDRRQAEAYWNQILRVAAVSGGRVGTKEGNDILEKATQRLNALSSEPDDAWKLSKRRRNSLTSSSSSGTKAVRPLQDSRRGSGNTNGAASGDVLQPAQTSSELESGASAITIKATPSSRPAASPAQQSFTSTRTGSVRPSFHFATFADYPSPPASPPDTPPQSAEEDFAQFATPARDPTTPSPPHEKLGSPDYPPSRRMKRVPSTASFQAPGLPRLMKRAESVTSVSTLPPDFFSSKHRLPSTMRTTAQSSATSSLANSTLARDDPALAGVSELRSTSGWTSSFRQRLLSLRANSTRLASNLNPFGAVRQSSAVDILSKVLQQDDRSAGDGMYWANASELEEHLEVSEPAPSGILAAKTHQAVFEGRHDEYRDEAPVPSSSGTSTPDVIRSASKVGPGRPTLRATRSFFDPTTATVSRKVSFVCPPTSPPPIITTTPPTPDKHGLVATVIEAEQSFGRRGSISRKGKRAVSGNALAMGDTDPYLLELERKSRVGVKTTCATCGKKSLNYPACPRCKTTYCSRACRISSGGGGDGVRHVCAPMGGD